MSPTSRSLRRWLFLAPLGIGAAAAAWLLGSGQEPEHLPEREVARPVRVIEAPALAAVPRAVGYGSVAPGRTWQAIAEVGGRVVEVHERLEAGAILRSGTVLLRIDRTDYDLALAEAKADLRATEAELAELAAREENARASLAIEREAFELATAELERQEKLAAQGAVSRSSLESQKRSTLAQRQRVQTEANMLNLVPAERRVLQARLARLQEPHRRRRARHRAHERPPCPSMDESPISPPSAGRWRRRGRCSWKWTVSQWRKWPPRFRSRTCAGSFRRRIARERTLPREV